MRTEPYFLPYQIDWIRDESPLKLCQKGRQVGLSFADSYDSVRKAARRGGRDVWVMSRDEIQAKQYVGYCKRWAQLLEQPLEDLGEHLLHRVRGQALRAQAIRFSSGATIFGLSSNPDAIVGKSGHVKLDEFALHKDQRTLYAVAKPVIQWGGTLAIISTHRGAGTVFNELIRGIQEAGNPMGWSLHTIPIQRAVEAGLVERIDRVRARRAAAGAQAEAITESRTEEQVRARREEWLRQQRAECIDEEQWLQEYCCVPADESAAFITYELITQCQEPGCLRDFEYLRRCRNPLYLGMDVARKQDLCVIDVGERIEDVIWDRLRLELQNASFAQSRAELYRLLRLENLQRACLDASGLGLQLAEEARTEFGWKVEPITFTAPIKEALAFGLRADLEERRLRLDPDDRLRADLRGIRKEVSLSGNIRFAGESADSHCDRFWAKALRQHAARYRVEAGAMVG
jgi:phage FluMu gp28-like protein